MKLIPDILMVRRRGIMMPRGAEEFEKSKNVCVGPPRRRVGKREEGMRGRGPTLAGDGEDRREGNVRI